MATTNTIDGGSQILGNPAEIKDGYIFAPNGESFKIWETRKKIAGLGGRYTFPQLVNHVATLFQQGFNGEQVAQQCGYSDSDRITKIKKIAIAFGLNEIDLSRKEIDTDNPEYHDGDFEAFMDVEEIQYGRKTKPMREFWEKIYGDYLAVKKKENDTYGARMKAQKACHGVFDFCKRLGRKPVQLVCPSIQATQGNKAWKDFMKSQLLTVDNTDGLNCKQFLMGEHAFLKSGKPNPRFKTGEGAYYNKTKWLRHFVKYCGVMIEDGDLDLVGWLDNATISTHGERAHWRITSDMATDFVKYAFGDKNTIKFPHPEMMGETAGTVAAAMLGFRKGEIFAQKMTSWTIETDTEGEMVIGRKILSHKKKHNRIGSIYMEKIAHDGNHYVLKKIREYIKTRKTEGAEILVGKKNQFVAPPTRKEMAAGIMDNYESRTFRGRDTEIRKVYGNIREIYNHMGLEADRSENPLHAIRHFAIQFWAELFDYDLEAVAEMMGYMVDGVVDTKEMRKSYLEIPPHVRARRIKKLLAAYDEKADK